MIIDKEYVKKHARIDDDIEDDVLDLYLESAEETVLNLMNRTLEDIYEEYGKVPAPIKHAVCILTAHSYTHREPSSIQQLNNVPYSVDALVKPFMIL